MTQSFKLDYIRDFVTSWKSSKNISHKKNIFIYYYENMLNSLEVKLFKK